ncbi:band 4.1-like protein 4 [Diaphorina citri]|uniref:Band 4.1-like protein 4 n=1 Tax=Diaphorina citri TaxID=121845 RepID=A0A3Q0JKI1_DIACI|nr:band 4.1-like protein 4 [Diaphorina citri]
MFPTPKRTQIANFRFHMYQFFLQIKQDILQGRLPVSFELSAELGAYVVQSELGDYDPRRHSPGYVSEFRFTSHQSAALESRVAELHRDLSGQTPSQAELNYLDRVKNLPLYGVDLHPVLGEDSIEYFLGLTPAGIVVLRNKIKVASYLCSGRGDKFSGGGRGSQMTRNPPSFTRTPSKRYQRRSEGGEEHPPQEEGGQEGFVRSSSRGGLEGVYSGSEMKSVSVPQPVSSMGYHPTRSDSPRSTRSAPWVTSTVTGPHQPRGLFSQSPRSVRSAGVHTFRHSSQRKKRSSSVESRSSNESKHCRRRRRSSRGKRGSDNESEHSRCSSRHRRRRHRSRAQCDGGSERGAPQGGSERGGTQRGSERGARIKASSEKQM